MHLLNKQTVFKNSFSAWCYEKIVYFHSTSSRTPQKKKQVASRNMKNKCISYFVKVKQHMQFWKKLWNYLWKNISTFCFKVVFYWKFRFNMCTKKDFVRKDRKRGVICTDFWQDVLESQSGKLYEERSRHMFWRLFRKFVH